jgi:SlyX protein
VFDGFIYHLQTKYFLVINRENKLMIKQLTELENKVAFQEDTIHRLNDVVCRQQNQIDALFEKYAWLLNSLENFSSNQLSDSEVCDLPPHY